jgi:predicted MFS family arabinose efflux permease
LRRIAHWAIPAVRHAPYGLVAALVLVRFADEWTTFFPAGSLEPIRHDLGLTYAEAAGVLVALPAGGLLGTFFVIAADYVSRRLLASLGALTYGAAMIAFGLGHSLPVLLAAAFAWGAASDAFVHGSEVALVDLAGDDLAKTLARMNAWASVGDLLAPLTLGLAAALGFGWRGAFLGGGAAMLGYAAWLASQPLPPPRPPASLANPFAGAWAILKDRQVLALALVLGLFALLDEPLDGFLIAYLERVRHLSAALATAPVMAVLVGGMGGYGAFERLAGERPARTVIGWSAALLALSLPATLFAPWLAAQMAAGLVFGAAGAVFYTTLESLTLSLRPGQAGATSAVIGLVGMLGMGFPALVGAVADAWGLAAGVGLYVAVPVAIAALVALRPRR